MSSQPHAITGRRHDVTVGDAIAVVRQFDDPDAVIAVLESMSRVDVYRLTVRLAGLVRFAVSDVDEFAARVLLLDVSNEGGQ